MKLTIANDFKSLWRDHTPEEFATLERNFLAYPSHFPPVVIWNDGKHWIIVEGHARNKICIKNGKNPKTVKLDVQTRQEALAYAVAAQAGRRNESAKEIAEAIVKNPIFAVSLANGSGHMSARVANKGGTDKSLAKAAGISTKTLQRARKAATAKPSETPTEESEKEEQKTTAAPTDEEGQPIPEKLLSIFRQADEFEAHAKALAKIQTWVHEISGEPCAVWLHGQSLVADLDNAKKALRFNKPYAVCPYCQAKDRKCSACKGHGFVSKGIYKAAPADLRI